MLGNTGFIYQFKQLSTWELAVRISKTTQMMTGTNGYKWMRMDTNGYEWYVCSHGGCTARWQWDQKRSFLFSKWTWCGVESFVTLALEDVESILSYQRQILGQILKALKEIETVGWAIAFAHCLSEKSPGGGQPFSLVIDFSWPLDIVYTFVRNVYDPRLFILLLGTCGKNED